MKQFASTTICLLRLLLYEEARPGGGDTASRPTDQTECVDLLAMRGFCDCLALFSQHAGVFPG